MDDEKVVGVTAGYRPLLAVSLVGPHTLADPGAEWHARVFAGVAARVPEARAFVTGALAGCPAGARDTLLLCATELCSNAIEHTASGEGGAFLVEVCRPAEGVACVAVTDGGGVGSPGLSMRNPSQAGCQGQDAQDRILADDLAEDGRGLALVAAFSSRWGYQPEIHTAWAEVAWLSPQPPVAVPKQGIWEDIDAQDAPGNDAA